jgi:hypothetical protein
MSRLYAKVKIAKGKNATMKAVGWICWEHLDVVIDKRGDADWEN